jgi:exonuclease III
MGYRIGSFNIQSKRHSKDGLNSKIDHGRDFFGFLSKMIKRERLNIIALQEVLNEGEFASAKNCVYGWSGHYENMSGSHSRFGLAFLWNPIIFRENSRYSIPQTVNVHSKFRLNREPLLGKFVPVNTGAFREYRLVNVHLTSGDLKQKNEECKEVFGPIYRKADSPKKIRPNSTVVLGDLNLSATVCNYVAAKVCEASDYPLITTVLNEMTHISKKDETGYSYNSSLYHFCYDEKYGGQVISIKRVDAVKDYFNGNFEEYINKISDHVPIVIEIS